MTTRPFEPQNAQSSQADWAAIKRLFEALVDLLASERAVKLARAEVGSAARTEVQTLLAHHANNTSDNPFLREPAAANFSDPSTAAGQRFGPWEIVQRLGVGGSFEGPAAIKWVRRGMNSVVVLRRFALEQQALARLNHPHFS
jgi:eukaryotic-like serine/threonine-protein kinase